ncbi:MAG: hypothetical protein LBS50_06170 [Prevotellaceae bacterium]|jgi:hypothetical protein|nr:hypothetical protein [Prevotellaceae bacterium]
MKTALQHTITIRFRRFLRKAYAVFCSLHKQITIGQLSVDTNNSSLKTLKNRVSKIFLNNTKNTDNEEFIEIITAENIFALNPVLAVAVVSNQSKNYYFHTEHTEIFCKGRRVFYTLRSLRFSLPLCVKNIFFNTKIERHNVFQFYVVLFFLCALIFKK